MESPVLAKRSDVNSSPDRYATKLAYVMWLLLCEVLPRSIAREAVPWTIVLNYCTGTLAGVASFGVAGEPEGAGVCCISSVSLASGRASGSCSTGSASS